MFPIYNFNPLNQYGLPQSPGILEARCKFVATMALRRYNNEKHNPVVIPTQEEWWGLNMKERDGEL